MAPACAYGAYLGRLTVKKRKKKKMTRKPHALTVQCYQCRRSVGVRCTSASIEGASMLRIFAIGLIAASLAACDATST